MMGKVTNVNRMCPPFYKALDQKTNRVKNVAFHSSLMEVLFCCHNGEVQHWDFSNKVKLASYNESVPNAIRGIDWHISEPVFATGGDDRSIRVYNSRRKTLWYTFQRAHMDYIRFVEFHKTLPLMITASDDHTAKIWHWKYRQHLTTLTGHTNYIMCASFSPRQDLCATASLDSFLRVWDITGLADRTRRGRGESKLGELFGTMGVNTRFECEGHHRGVNWVQFHKQRNMFLSCGDDNRIILWRFSNQKYWAVWSAFSKHTFNVSAACFDEDEGYLVSNSEDRTTRVYNLDNPSQLIFTYRREGDRFWCVKKHPTLPYFGVGHDSGVVVFKLARFRTPFVYVHHINVVFYITYDPACVLWMFDYNSDGKRKLGTLGKETWVMDIHYNIYNTEAHELVLRGKNGELRGIIVADNLMSFTETKRPEVKDCTSLAFISRSRVIQSTKDVLTKNHVTVWKSDLERVLTTDPGLPEQYMMDKFFTSGMPGCIWITSKDLTNGGTFLWDIDTKMIVKKLDVKNVREVLWNRDRNRIAMRTKKKIVIYDANMKRLSMTLEKERIKSFIFTIDNAIIYSTKTQIKYLLPNSRTGIIGTTYRTHFLIRLLGDSVHCFNSDHELVRMDLDLTEFNIKCALLKEDYTTAYQLLSKHKTCGMDLTKYLEENDFPEIALLFVKDPQTRFNLAIKAGNIPEALKSAEELKNEDNWKILAQEAAAQGNMDIVETTYKHIHNYDGLNFLYMLTGSVDKLFKMMKIAEMRESQDSRFSAAVLLGSAEERVKVLRETGQLHLAYLCACTHGMEDEAESIVAELKASLGDDEEIFLPEIPEEAHLFMSPTPYIREATWPMLRVQKSVFDNIVEQQRLLEKTKRAPTIMQQSSAVVAEPTGAWEEDLDLDLNDQPKTEEPAEAEAGPNSWNLDDDDLDLDMDGLDEPAAGTGTMLSGSDFQMPGFGMSHQDKWSTSHLSSDLFAAGRIEAGLELLRRQIGAIDITPFKKHILKICQSSEVYLPTTPSTTKDPITIGLNRPLGSSGKPRPQIPFTLEYLSNIVQLAYEDFRNGKFDDCKAKFREILELAPLTIVEKSETNQLKGLVETCREYIVALELETLRGASSDPVKQLEYVAYMSHCDLQSAHAILVLNRAQTSAFKGKCFIAASSFAQRLLQIPEMSNPVNAALRAKTQKVAVIAQRQARNELDINYDERNPFVVCCKTYEPIYQGSPSVKCPYCLACYVPNSKGEKCSICKISEIGVKTIGLVCSE